MRPPQINMLDNPVYQDQWVINGHCSAEKNSAHLHCLCSWLAQVSEGRTCSWQVNIWQGFCQMIQGPTLVAHCIRSFLLDLILVESTR